MLGCPLFARNFLARLSVESGAYLFQWWKVFTPRRFFFMRSFPCNFFSFANKIGNCQVLSQFEALRHESYHRNILNRRGTWNFNLEVVEDRRSVAKALVRPLNFFAI
jgi:hypothetical protein